MNECTRASYILFFLKDALQVKFPSSDSADDPKPKCRPSMISNAITVSAIEFSIEEFSEYLRYISTNFLC